VILMAGLQGAGKTTTVAKLASLLKERDKKKVTVVSADVYRPAAIKQLETLAAEVGVDFFASDAGQKPVAIVLAALAHAQDQVQRCIDRRYRGSPGHRRGHDERKSSSCTLRSSRSRRCSWWTQ
jgi:signal recognition particle GTPase